MDDVLISLCKQWNIGEKEQWRRNIYCFALDNYAGIYTSQFLLNCMPLQETDFEIKDCRDVVEYKLHFDLVNLKNFGYHRRNVLRLAFVARATVDLRVCCR